MNPEDANIHHHNQQKHISICMPFQTLVYMILLQSTAESYLPPVHEDNANRHHHQEIRDHLELILGRRCNHFAVMCSKVVYNTLPKLIQKLAAIS